MMSVYRDKNSGDKQGLIFRFGRDSRRLHALVSK